MLLAADYYQGFTLTQVFGESFRFLESNRGFLSWSTYFKIGFCRLISFNMDLYYNYQKKENYNIKQLPGYEKFNDYRKRQEMKLQNEEYSFLNFMTYIFYLPLYLAGPICCYNAFISFIKKPQEQYNYKQCVFEVLKVVFYYITLEVILHYSYIVAISHNLLWTTEAHSYWRSLGMNPMETHEIFVIPFHCKYLIN